MAAEDENNTNPIQDIASNKKKLISNWWDQTTELYSQLLDSEDIEKEKVQNHIQNFAIEKKNEIFNDINGISNDIISNVFEQVFGLSTHNPGRLDDILPVIVGPLKKPTELQYMKCLEKDGDIVWDTEGQFNCLFPESFLKAKNLQGLHLSKEQVARDTEHKKYGLFFNDYTKYLTWKFANKKKDISIKTQDDNVTKKKDGNYEYFSTYTKQYSDAEGNVQKQTVVEKKTQTPEGIKIRIEKTTFPNDGSNPNTQIEEKLIPK
ncbi:hypothetical protein QEN19_001337 [Hanseniaspora menglaensis]